MMNMHLLNRSGLAAIAVATALLSTPALGQEATPVAPDAAPIVVDEALTVEPLPTPAPEAATDTLAPAPTATAPAARTERTARATVAPAARAPASASRTMDPVAAAPIAAVPAGDALPSADPAMVAPLPEPAAVAPVIPTGESMIGDDMLPIAGAAGLGILALAGAGFAMRRRRRNDEEAMVEETAVDGVWNEPTMSRPAPVVSATPIAAPSPVMATAPVAPSAFGWDKQHEAPRPLDKPIDRIDAAKRGPTPDNPSLSLKKRLKRAAFFDQRDRQIAAGKGIPISATAGLPDAMTPVAPAATTTPIEPMRRTNPGLSMTFGKTFEPA